MTAEEGPRNASADITCRVLAVVGRIVATLDSLYVLRELRLADAPFYDDRSQRILHGVTLRPYFLRLAIVNRTEPEYLLASFIASSRAAASHALTVHRTQSTLDGMDPAVASFLVEQLLLAADIFGYACGATTVRIHDVGDTFFQGLLENAGFEIGKKSGFLFAVRRIDAAVASRLI
jgi:hypothetical protein